MTYFANFKNDLSLLDSLTSTQMTWNIGQFGFQCQDVERRCHETYALALLPAQLHAGKSHSLRRFAELGDGYQSSRES